MEMSSAANFSGTVRVEEYLKCKLNPRDKDKQMKL